MRAAGSYETLIRGVSQQVPQERAPGQHTEQVNMLSDPVNGLTRRHGSTLVAERKLTSLSTAQFAAYQADTDNWRTIEYSYGGNDYVVLLRTKARPAGASPLPVMLAFNKTTNAFILPTRNTVDAQLDILESGGISAATTVGKYIYMAGNDTTVLGTGVDRWNNSTNNDRAVVWIRGGAYSRTFTGTFTKHDGTHVTASITTPTSAYPGTLDTSDIPATATDYTKQVNDRVNAYNSAVTNWIATSTAGIQPSTIATNIANGLVADYGIAATAMGSHVILSGIKSVSVYDGGDGSLARGVADEVESADKLSLIHHVGKVVKIRASGSGEAYYMKAIPKDKTVTTGYTEVTWVECAGVEQSIVNALQFATIVSDNLYVASSPALLTALTAGPHPTYAVSKAGDEDSSATPYPNGRKITYLATFQNRLLVGSGGVVTVSKVGDYLDFFRSTVLSVPADDPFEMQAQGADDDILRHSVLYDQSLVIFGDKRQYMISGKVALAPTSANMAVMSNYADVVDAPPHTAGGLIFYAKKGEKFSSVHQVQPGQGLQNSPEAYIASSQIDSYLPGKVIELTSNASPSYLFARTTGNRSAVFAFFYVDSPQGRKLDSWSRWDFDPALGMVIGMSPVPDGVNLYYLRDGYDGVYVVCDKCVLTTGLSLYPYLDSQRPYASVTAGTGSVRLASTGPWFAAYNSDTTARFLGTDLSAVAGLIAAHPSATGLRVGAEQQCYFEPTNPYMRDGKDKVILSGRLTVTKLIAALSKSSGFTATVYSKGDVISTTSFNGRIVGDGDNTIGVEHVGTGQYTIPIGRETRAYTLRMAARKWLPFTVTGIEWSGQFFNRTQRF